MVVWGLSGPLRRLRVFLLKRTEISLGRGEKRDFILEQFSSFSGWLAFTPNPLLQTVGMCRENVPMLGTCRHTELEGGNC